MIAPAMMSPIRCGIRSLFRIIGAKRIIKSINAKINTGLSSGSDKFKCIKISFIRGQR
jgi:hypothetical protein